jgi:hypothetical protein
MKTHQTNRPNQPINQPTNRPPQFSNPQHQQAMTDERIKQAILDTLIELNLVPKPQKKKALNNV